MNFNPVRETTCPQCPFARATPKEYLDTRGYNGDRFAGQANGPFLLPCHMEDPDGEGMARVDASNRQCAGAAKFRSNIGIASLMPKELPTLPEDTETVFANEIELIAHHLGVSEEDALQHLIEAGGVVHLMLNELAVAEAMGRQVRLGETE